MSSRVPFFVAALSLVLASGAPLAPIAQAAGGGSSNTAPNSSPPWLGVSLEPGKTGALVKMVIPDSPAATAGIVAGDEITSVADVPVKTPAELIATVRTLGVGRTVRVDYEHEGKARNKMVTLVARPDPQELTRKRVIGKAVPAFALEPVAGSAPTSSTGLKGQVVVLEFWATWCGACRASHPKLSEYAKSRRGKGVTVVAVSDEEPKDLKAYADVITPEFTIARDKGRVLHDAWMISAFPTLVVVDKNGNATMVATGAGGELDDALAEADKLAQIAPKK